MMLEKSQAIAAQLVEWRRDFHRHPEGGFREHRTAQRVAETLQALGYRVRSGVGRTGVVGDLGEGAPLVAVRADMDALPIVEANDVPYASQNPGWMHACGHDSHTAMALGAARLLAGVDLPGTVRFLFQPSEEANDAEGMSGAPRMIEDGAMEGVERVLALHVDPATPVGQICLRVGPASGGVDSWFATIRGEGGHGSAPHKTVDPIYLCGHVILAINGVISRRLDPFAPAVLSIGSLRAGQAENVIPDQVELNGTIRYMDPEIQKVVHAELERAFELARTLGGDYNLRIEVGTPPMINDAGVVKLIESVAGDLLGAENVLLQPDGLGAEDFGCFSEIAPGAMFSLGSQIEGDPRLAHNPRFDIDERCLPIGTAILAESVLRIMRGER
ncbi:MAG: peptidase M20 [Anaerolineae bacterium UTCFX2]|jgi:amidohydrolase|nr:M20 family metallopeptidase [Anaerolineales bacterium]OQY92873.1 MAG: peptidase M20 [Anaerolineae bacterium UTCFX2]